METTESGKKSPAEGPQEEGLRQRLEAVEKEAQELRKKLGKAEQSDSELNERQEVIIYIFFKFLFVHLAGENVLKLVISLNQFNECLCWK